MKRTILFFLISIFLVSCATKLTNNEKIQIKEDLAKMVEIDQIAAYIPQGKYKNYSKEQWNDFKDSVFTNNKKRKESKLYTENMDFLALTKLARRVQIIFGS